MSYLITETESTKLDVPLISIPDDNGNYLLIKTDEGFEWQSYSRSTELSSHSTDKSIMVNITVKFVDAADRIGFINNDGVNISLDGYEYCLNGLNDELTLLVVDPSTFSITERGYGDVKTSWLNLV